MLSAIFCPICKDGLGFGHTYVHAPRIRDHVAEKHPDVAAAASEIEAKIRDFRKRYGRMILKTP